MKSETKTCQNCKKDFTIEPDDFGFYEKIKFRRRLFVPECRMQRRFAWKNNISLYNRKCDLCKKGVITIYSNDSKLSFIAINVGGAINGTRKVTDKIMIFLDHFLSNLMNFH